MAELRQLVRRPAWADTAGEPTIRSTQYGSGDAVVVVDGAVDPSTAPRLAACLATLLATGTRKLVVDVSRAARVDGRLLDLMRRVESRMLASDGEFELTGLAPSVLYSMDDGSLTEVFSVHRAALDDGDARAVSWAYLCCPLGLTEVPEPRTAARHRAFIDLGGAR